MENGSLVFREGIRQRVTEIGLRSHRKQWVKTNLDYGYGCVCMQMKVNTKTHEVLAVKHTRVQSLEKCRNDRALEKRKPMLK